MVRSSVPLLSLFGSVWVSSITIAAVSRIRSLLPSHRRPNWKILSRGKRRHNARCMLGRRVVDYAERTRNLLHMTAVVRWWMFINGDEDWKWSFPLFGITRYVVWSEFGQDILFDADQLRIRCVTVVDTSRQDLSTPDTWSTSKTRSHFTTKSTLHCVLFLLFLILLWLFRWLRVIVVIGILLFLFVFTGSWWTVID